jgi:hypothetical protein
VTQPVEQVTDAGGTPWNVPSLAKATDPTVPAPLRIWDCLDQTWTSPIVRVRVFDQYLNKRTVKCSACRYTTFVNHARQGNGAQMVGTLKDQLAGHIQNVQKLAQDHVDAEVGETVMNNGQSSQICTGCGLTLPFGKVLRHIVDIRAESADHQRVEALLLNRFTLEPSEPTIFFREVVVDGPDVRQVALSTPPREGRRRRRRRGGNSRG